VSYVLTDWAYGIVEIYDIYWRANVWSDLPVLFKISAVWSWFIWFDWKDEGESVF
jgi:hypothetical protein